MEFFEVIEKRYSHKEKFLPHAVPLEDLERITKAGLAAPSGGNSQCVRLVILPNREIIQMLCELSPTDGLRSAPAAIAVLTEASVAAQTGEYNFEVEDYSAAADNMLLAAVALGYQSLWLDFQWFTEKNQKAALGILGAPESCRLRVLLPVGLPDGAGSRRDKLPFDKRVSYGKYGCKNITAAQAVSEMKIGWNLGNTFDAASGGRFTQGDPETAWVNIATTKGMIDKIAEAGFNVLRVPITWDTGEGIYRRVGAAPDYTVRQQFLERIEEVVNWGLDNGMYVIINTHHDRWIYLTDENYDTESVKLAKIWTQIARYFKDYGEKLIFELMNEPLFTDSGGNHDWTGKRVYYENLNRLNQSALDAVRATGGNNEKRFVMVPTYAASSGTAQMNAFALPSDMHADRLIVSVHAYTPYNFALNTDATHNKWGTASDRRELDSLFSSIDKIFVSKGIPVILGEFGAMNKDNEEVRAEWAKYYIAGARRYGIPCVWWDNNIYTGNGERFGLLNRAALEFPYPLLLQGLMDGLTEILE